MKVNSVGTQAEEDLTSEVDLSGPSFSEYENLIEQEDKFEQDIINLLDYIKNSDMMDFTYEGEKELDLDLLRNWKSLYGRLYASKITDDSVIYVWRPLLRLEYKQMVGDSGKNNGTVNWADDYLRQNEILKKCLLFPKPTDNWLRNIRAGVAKTLEQQISFQSGFISEELAIRSIEMLG